MLAFLDIEMFGLNGLELAKLMREYSNNTKIIFVTGYPQYMHRKPTPFM